MRKYNEKKHSAVLFLVGVVAVSAVIGLLLRSLLPATPQKTPVSATTEPAQTLPAETAEPSAPAVIDRQEDQTVINLGYGLKLTDSGKYMGLYVEDGSNDVLEDVMMIVVENDGDQDIQLAEITARCGEEEYTFTLTNLAVGERAVLLDLQRKPFAGVVSAAVIGKAALFDAPMELREDTLEITGKDGELLVKNISDSDISGDIYIYYKYAAQDLFYGGITFRVRVEGGLESGGLRQIQAGHYNPEGCTIVQVSIHE